MTLLIQVECFECGQLFAAREDVLRHMARTYGNRTLCFNCLPENTY